MTKIRYYDSDTPFGQWLRSQKELPSNSIDFGLIASDVDMLVEVWKTKRTGKVIKSIMMIEVKTRQADSDFAQMQLLSAMSAFAGKKDFPDVQFRFYGVCFLLLDGTQPDNSSKMIWRRFPLKMLSPTKSTFDAGHLISSDITKAQLLQLLRLEIHPISLRTFQPETSHHGSKLITIAESMPLGFNVDRVVKKSW